MITRIPLLNYRFSQKFKLLGNGEFNHLIIILILSLTYGFKLSLNKWGLTCGIFILSLTYDVNLYLFL